MNNLWLAKKRSDNDNKEPLFPLPVEMATNVIASFNKPGWSRELAE